MKIPLEMVFLASNNPEDPNLPARYSISSLMLAATAVAKRSKAWVFTEKKEGRQLKRNGGLQIMKTTRSHGRRHENDETGRGERKD